MTEKFDLARFVREVRDATDLVDPGELWPHVLEKLAPADYAGALRETLPDYVRHVLKLSSEPTMKVADPMGLPSTPGSESTKDGSLSTSSSTIPSPGESRRRRSSGLLATARFDGDEWRELGDCDAPFLRRAAAYRREVADFVVRSAERYSVGADELEARGLIYVRELPEDVARKIFSS